MYGDLQEDSYYYHKMTNEGKWRDASIHSCLVSIHLGDDQKQIRSQKHIMRVICIPMQMNIANLISILANK